MTIHDAKLLRQQVNKTSQQLSEAITILTGVTNNRAGIVQQQQRHHQQQDSDTSQQLSQAIGILSRLHDVINKQLTTDHNSGATDQVPTRVVKDVSPLLVQPIDNIIVAVVTSRYRQNETVPAIKKTWGPGFAHLDYYSATQGPLVTQVVPTDPRWARSSWEEMNALKKMYEMYPDAPWYYKCDDDAYVRPSALAEVASRYDPAKDWYIGNRMNYGDTGRSYCTGGCGYLVSNSLMKKLAPRLLDPIKSCCSDVQVGDLVSNVTDGSVICTHLDAFRGHFMAHMHELAWENGDVALGTDDLFAKSAAWHFVDPNGL